MPRRKALKRIACGIADSFIGRNNDVDGYWAPGKLYSEAKKEGVKEVKVDLLSNIVSNEIKHLALEAVRSRYQDSLQRYLTGEGLSLEYVSEADIVVVFENHGDLAAPPFFTRGEPFLCKVKVTDDLGKAYTEIRVSRCAPHDPKIDLRRAQS